MISNKWKALVIANNLNISMPWMKKGHFNFHEGWLCFITNDIALFMTNNANAFTFQLFLVVNTSCQLFN
jgi:hypothetical protein